MTELVTRFASVFVDLCEAGDASVLDYRKIVQCDIDNPESNNGLKTEIEELEQQLINWKASLSDHRSKNAVLNYFTVKQLSLIHI